ncbi:MAG: hypothetical protein KAT32_03065 [Candidatus Moranbacteria bacterium]|nr:hypothetical protein [Candidatus Moranbacteria bacterium]
MNKVVLILIMIILIIYFIVAQAVPSVQTVLKLKTDRDDKIAEVQETEEKKNKFNAFKKGVELHSDELNFVSNFVPKDPIENDIINIFDQKAKDNKISLFKIDFTDKAPKINRRDSAATVVHSSEANIMFTGEYDNIKKFLNEIFLMNRLYSFDTLHIEKIVVNKAITDESSSLIGDLNVNMTFNYSYIPKNLSMTLGDVANISDKADDNYKFVNFVKNLTTQLKEFEVANPGRPNPFSPKTN